MDSNSTARSQLGSGTLSVSEIVFFVVAAAAPLGATLGVGPVVFAVGGAGAPGMYLVASLILLCFAVGFAAMSRYVISAGGFAALVERGLGHHAGSAAAGVALLAYMAMLSGIYGQFAGFGADLLSANLGINIPWQVLMMAIVLIIGVFGYLDVNLSAKVLGVLLVMEVLILLVFDVAVLLQVDPAQITLDAFSPAKLAVPGLGVAIMFAFACFVGFESTTIYSEEARDPQRTVPMATYVSILIIGAFYSVTMWCMGLAYAGQDVQAAAQQDIVGFVLSANTKYVGALSTKIMEILVVTSVFAVLLSFHNALARYIFALARTGFLPAACKRVHPVHRSPYIASLSLSVACAIIMAGFIAVKADPIAVILMWMVGLGTLSVITLQAAGAIAVIGFWLRERKLNVVEGLIFPVIGAAGLIAVLFVALTNFSELTGSKEGLAVYLPWALPLAIIVGLFLGWKRQAISSMHATA